MSSLPCRAPIISRIAFGLTRFSQASTTGRPLWPHPAQAIECPAIRAPARGVDALVMANLNELHPT